MKKRKVLIVVIVALACLLSGLIVQFCFFIPKEKGEGTSSKEFKQLDIKIKKEVEFQGLKFSNFQIRTCKEEYDGSCEINLDDYTFAGTIDVDADHPSVLTIDFRNLNSTVVPSFAYEIVLFDNKGKVIITLFGQTRDIEGNAEGLLRILTPVDLSKVKDYKLGLQKNTNKK